MIEVHPTIYDENRNFKNTLLKLMEMGFRFKYVVSAAVSNPDLFKEKGYKPFKVMDCGGCFKRGIFKGISQDDAVNFCSGPHTQPIKGTDKISNKIVRSILLEKRSL
jgi:hypothetical protein